MACPVSLSRQETYARVIHAASIAVDNCFRNSLLRSLTPSNREYQCNLARSVFANMQHIPSAELCVDRRCVWIPGGDKQTSRSICVHNGLVRFRSGMYIPAGEPNDDAPQEVELALPVAAEDQPRHWYQRHCDCEDRKL